MAKGLGSVGISSDHRMEEVLKKSEVYRWPNVYFLQRPLGGFVVVGCRVIRSKPKVTGFNACNAKAKIFLFCTLGSRELVYYS